MDFPIIRVLSSWLNASLQAKMKPASEPSENHLQKALQSMLAHLHRILQAIDQACSHGRCQGLPSVRLCTFGLAFLFFGVWIRNDAAGWYQDPSSSKSGATSTSSMADRISTLIELLADVNYASRLNAQAELERIGVVALDQLHSASFHPDPQIASAARYIVQSNQFSWAWETDSVRVRQILANYGNSPRSEKSAYIDSLRLLEHDEGFAALCRLVRYETQGSLAKRAALLLMRSKPTVGQTLANRKDSLFENVSGGQSQASRWLQKYSEAADEFDLPWWEQTLQTEIDALRRNSGETSMEIVSDLHRWIIEQISGVPSLRNQALTMGRSLLQIGSLVRTLDVVAGNKTSKADEFAQWALKFRMPELVQLQHDMLPKTTLTREFIFCYLLAESFQLDGKPDLAEQVAAKARKQIACDSNAQEIVLPENTKRDPIRAAIESNLDRQGLRSLDRRKMLAERLRERGHFSWAEAEYRLALFNDESYRPKSQPRSMPKEQSEPTVPDIEPNDIKLDLTDFNNILALRDLADMLHAQSRHGEAADTLEPFLQRFKREPMFKRQLLDSARLPSYILSSYEMYRGDEAKEAGDLDKAKDHYWLSIDQNSDNVDALIGLYRLALPENEQELRRSKLKEIITNQRAKIRNDEESLKASDSRGHAFYLDQLATDCNTLAWIIANTEGSKEEALFLSRRACTIHPESAELIDTLAHCYAALGRYQDAVQQQRRAIELKPHHPELKRALKRFESSLNDTAPK